MTLRALILVGAAGSGLALGLQAQEAAPPIPDSLSLREAVNLAYRYNPTYRQAQNDRGPAAWGVRNSYTSLFLPSVTASMGATYSGAGSQRFLTTDFVQESSTIGSSYSVSLNWQFNGATLMAPGVQTAAHQATLASIDATSMQVRNLVVRQYLAVLEAQAQVELQRQQVVRNEENLRLAQARFEVGQRTLLDVRQAEVAKGQADVALLQAEHNVTVALLRLFQQLGVPAPDDPASVALSDTFPVVEPDWTLDGLLTVADADNPDLLALRAQASSAGRNESAAKSQWLPSLSFSAGWQGFTQQFTNSDFLVSQAAGQAAAQTQRCADQNAINVLANLPQQDCSAFAFTPATEQAIRAGNSRFPFDFQRQPFFARVSVSLPIFDRFDRNLQVSQASAQTDDAAEAVRARELQVRTDVSQMHYAVLAAYETIGLQERNQVSAQEQLRLARERYRVGSGTFFELLDAQVVGQQAEADYITALYAYHRAVADLEAAVGRQLR